MANKSSRKLTARELVLLIFLITLLLVGLYFWLVYYPIRDRISDLNKEQDDLEVRMAVAEIRKANYDRMKRELDEILQEENPTHMPSYDNIDKLVDRFAEAFTGNGGDEAAYEPDIIYSSPVYSDGIYARSIRFSFRCADYGTAKKILADLLGTGYRCLMTDLSVEPASSEGDVQNGPVAVETTIVFYELG